MIIRQQIRFAVFGSVVLHLLFAFGITTMLAYKRSLPPGNDDFNNALDLGSGYNFSSFSDFTYACFKLKTAFSIVISRFFVSSPIKI